MIVLDVEKYCSMCQDFEPEIIERPSAVEDWGDGSILSKRMIGNTVIVCAHKHRCENIYNYISHYDHNKGERGNEQ